jgi:hypothetical protein
MSLGRGVVRLTTFLLVVQVSAAVPQRLSAQVRIHAQAIPLLTRAWRTPGDKAISEFALVQPALMLEWEQPMSESMEAAPHFSARLTLDGEGLTIPDGELAPGDYGEGFYDRRHPHTYVHELMLSGSDLLGRHDGELQLSLSAGRGSWRSGAMTR